MAIRASRDWFKNGIKVDKELRETTFSTFEHKVVIKSATVARLMSGDIERACKILNKALRTKEQKVTKGIVEENRLNFEPTAVEGYITKKFVEFFAGGKDCDNFEKYLRIFLPGTGVALAKDKHNVSLKKLTKGKNYHGNCTNTQMTVHLHQGIIGLSKKMVTEDRSYNVVLACYRRCYEDLFKVIYNEMVDKLSMTPPRGTITESKPINQYLLIRAHGLITGAGEPKESVKGGQTTMAAVAVFTDYLEFKSWLKIQWKKQKSSVENHRDYGVNFAEETIDQLVTMYEDAISQDFSLAKFLNDKRDELRDTLIISIDITDRSEQGAMSFYDMRAVSKRLQIVYVRALRKLIKKDIGLWAKMKGSDSRTIRARKIAQTQVIESLLKVKGTRPDFRLKVNKKLLKQSKVKGKKRDTIGVDGLFTGVKATKALIKKSRQARGGKKIPSRSRVTKQRTAQSPVALRNLLNELLPAQVAANMGSPALNYRTGRFANSAQVRMIHQGTRGGMGIDYTYMKYPYQTFEPGFAQGSTMRDPRKIIGESIRELAMGILGRQPHTIRRT